MKWLPPGEAVFVRGNVDAAVDADGAIIGWSTSSFNRWFLTDGSLVRPRVNWSLHQPAPPRWEPDLDVKRAFYREAVAVFERGRTRERVPGLRRYPSNHPLRADLRTSAHEKAAGARLTRELTGG